jgi:hypothetical protein
VKKPDPEQGLVIRYDYLWRDEAARGRQEGTKVRPCAIVIARTGEGEEARVWLAPITHTPPSNPKGAVEIPAKVKQHLGLDEQRSWIIADELNGVAWGDPGIVPAKRTQWEYGFLPPKLTKAIVDKTLEQQQSQKLKISDRVLIEKRRARDEGNGR